MKLSEFNFDLPNKLIAQKPSERRDESKLMVLHKDSGKIEHRIFKDVLEYFDDGDVMVRNNTKVFPARLFGRKEKTGAKIEVFLLRELNRDSMLWDVLVDPARKIRVGNKLYFGNEENVNDLLIAEVVDNTTSRGRTIRFLFEGTPEEFRSIMHNLGQTPLPSYIEREPDEIDRERYQTVYASVEGAVAAPTAGLHFSHELLKKLEIKGIDMADITLHVGLGTFRNIEVEDLSKHKMDAEYFTIPDKAIGTVNIAKDEKQRICSVGTTTMRALESSVSAIGNLKKMEGWTNLFIHPPYEFNIADSMITNFHLPKSSLLIMVSAFAGYENVLKAYETAVKKKYKFYTYGDAMLIV